MPNLADALYLEFQDALERRDYEEAAHLALLLAQRQGYGMESAYWLGQAQACATLALRVTIAIKPIGGIE